MKLLDVYSRYNVTPKRAEGMYVYDTDENKYLDLYGGHAVISIGHSHPYYIQSLKNQLDEIGFYSNAVHNPLQDEVASKLGDMSGCNSYKLFFVNSGAEANENALKLASFATNKSKIVAFKNGFHGRTSAAVAATDNADIIAPINKQHDVELVILGSIVKLEKVLRKGDCCAVILECIQGVGGLDTASSKFYISVAQLCKRYGVKLIADEIQCGFGRTGDFFAFQKYGIQPDIITMAKGMGNGFPVGGILLHPSLAVSKGMLGTTFGGNHLACVATLAVLEVLEKEGLMKNAIMMEKVFRKKASALPAKVKTKGRGLMLGLEFPYDVSDLRRRLIYHHHVFTGGASNKNILRLLPPLTINEDQLNQFFYALNKEL